MNGPNMAFVNKTIRCAKYCRDYLIPCVPNNTENLVEKDNNTETRKSEIQD